jgi:hypothetical protein
MIVASLCIGAVIVIGANIVVLQTRDQPFPDLSWGVDARTVYQFQVSTWGNALGGGIPVLEILSLSGSIINVTVTCLPILSGLSVVSFLENVVELEKVNCTYSDGILLPSFSTTQIVAALSGCLLPNGSGALPDSLLPDETPGWTPEAEFYASSGHTDYFRMMYVWFGGVDDEGGWTGNSSLVTGVPYEVLWWYSHGPETVYMQLTSV